MRKLVAEVFYDPDDRQWTMRWIDGSVTTSASGESFPEMMRRHDEWMLDGAYLRSVEREQWTAL